jgi:hypothetical protein
MAKFKIGDVVVGLKSHYTITKQGWEGRVTKAEDTHGLVEVNGKGLSSSTVVEAKYFRLKEKTKEMAVKKQTTKGLKLADGQYFTATFKKKKVRGYVEENYGDFMLLGKDFDDDAEDDEEFPTALFIDMYAYDDDDSHTNVLKNNGITNFVLCTDKRQKAIIDGDKSIEVNGHRVHIKGNNVEFGCGAVSATKKEIKDFYSVYKGVDISDLESYNDIIERFSKEELEAAINHHNYLQMQTPAAIKAFSNIVKQMEEEDVRLDDLDSSEVKQLIEKLD